MQAIRPASLNDRSSLMTMRWIALAALAATTAFVPAVQAQKNDDSGTWLVRGRAIYLDPVGQNTALDLSINSKLFPEVDISYFFTPNIAAELVLTYPQKQDVRLGGTTIGTLKHLPPTLSLQYHFTGMSFRPYVGVGLNYTLISSVNLPAGVTVDKNSTGLALGAGVDVPMGGGWLFNVDLKKVQIGTNVTVAGTSYGKFKIDPMLFSVGVGKRF
jgi:outer membrane protein